MTRKLVAFLEDVMVGTLAEANDLWRFDYDPVWASRIDAFDLSPSLPRAQLAHVDGATTRSVQWYFDNLLPEEAMRDTVAKEAGLQAQDSFALLEYLGAESAGSLVLLPDGQTPSAQGDLRELTDESLCERIRNMSRIPLTRRSPKRMSVAGAQSKLLVVYRDDRLFEPEGHQPSTHLLKPNHLSDDYPATVINEFVTMRLAGRLGLPVPAVHRHYTPEPVYIVARFDRVTDAEGRTRRLHIIDACQLLNKSRVFKYSAATLQTLQAVIGACRNRPRTRLQLFNWLVFNVLIGNHDNHLKNLSFMVGQEGIELAPAYDLLCTAAYNTRPFADERANWPAVDLAIALPEAKSFATVTREALLLAGMELGIARRACEHTLGSLASALSAELAAEIREVEKHNAGLPEAARRFLAGELRLLRVMQHVIVPEMLQRIAVPR
jgi:serine/threonine-protein kinase HipA